MIENDEEEKGEYQFDPNEKGLVLVPCAPHLCQACACDHKPEEPHNQESLYWQYWFYLRNEGKWPTWKDAIAHCTPETQELWTEALKQYGVEI